MFKLVKGTPQAKDVKLIEKDEPIAELKPIAKISIKTIKVEPDIEEVEPGKIDQAAVHYLRPGSVCKNCTHFLEPDGCDVVSGYVKPEGVCMLWSKGSAAEPHDTYESMDESMDDPFEVDEE